MTALIQSGSESVVNGMKDSTSTKKEHVLGRLLLQIEDPRNSDMVYYPIAEIFFLLISACLCGCDKLTEVQQFGDRKLSWLRGYFPFAKGIPSHDTIGRVLSLVNKDAFESLFIHWVCEHFQISETELINIDGKRISSSANRAKQAKSRVEGGRYAEIIVNVYASAAGIVLAQRNVSDKMDEVQGARDLLEALDIAGCCISGDSNFCGRDLISQIVGKQAHYLLALKGKSPKLHQAVVAAAADPTIDKHVFTTEEKGHGRHEKREYQAFCARALSQEVIESYSGLAQIVAVKRFRHVIRTGKKEEQVHYYITSLTQEVEQLAHSIRAHWRIENQLHHVLDVTYAEDDSRLRTKNAATNQSLIRKITLNLLKTTRGKGSVKSQRLDCALSDEHRDHILKLMMR
jgi:predicted transposase YbfD/YdcC